MKKILTIAAILALAIGLMVPTAGGGLFSDTTSGPVIISVSIPNIQVMDMGSSRLMDIGASENDVTWVKPTAADLDAGYVLRPKAITFVVDSNCDWRVEVSPAVDEFCSDNSTWAESAYTGLSVANLFIRAHEVLDSGNDMTIRQTDWKTATFTDSSSVIELCDGDSTSDAKVLVDYKININWDTTPGNYYMKLIYSLESGKGS